MSVTPTPAPVPQSPRQVIGTAINWVLTLPEIIFLPFQRIFGTQRVGYLFVLPNLLIFGIFILLPMLLNFYFGFTDGQSILPENRAFVGTENLQDLMTCEDYVNWRTCEEDRFWRALGNTTFYVIAEVAAIVFFALVTALALNNKIMFRGFFRSVFFYPVLLSPVVVALIWSWILETDSGILNAIIEAFGGERISFLTEANWAIFWVIIVGVWAQMGFYTLILLAGLQAIPRDLYEAASVAGASAWVKLRFITLPLLMPTMTVVLVLSLIRAVQVFDHVFVMTGGQPGTSTLYIVQYIYQRAFADREFGLAAGASLILAIALLILTVIQLRLQRQSIADTD